MSDLLNDGPGRKHYDFLNMQAREKYGLPDDWEWFKWERKGDIGGDAEWLKLTGASRPPVRTRGKYKGTLNWPKRDKRTEATVSLTRAEMESWELQWERRTGECHKCHGNGQRCTGWSAANGNRYEPCNRCDATGVAPSARNSANCGIAQKQVTTGSGEST